MDPQNVPLTNKIPDSHSKEWADLPLGVLYGKCLVPEAGCITETSHFTGMGGGGAAAGPFLDKAMTPMPNPIRVTQPAMSHQKSFD